MKFRLSDKRGASKNNWLDSRHSFSFGNYYDEEWMSFNRLRVLNEDWIAPGTGFPMHPHNNMEIVTVMLTGEISHRDSMGNEGVIHSGETQAMTAGTGILHSEWNSSKETTYLFQLWIEPKEKGLTPSYDQFKPVDSHLQLLASGSGGGLKINSDAEVIRQRLKSGESWSSEEGNHTYVHVIKGALEVGGMKLHEGDAVAFENEKESLISSDNTELLIIKMY